MGHCTKNRIAMYSSLNLLGIPGNSYRCSGCLEWLNVILRLVLHHSETFPSMSTRYRQHSIQSRISSVSFVPAMFALMSKTRGFKGFLSHLVNKSRLFLCPLGFLPCCIQLLPHRGSLRTLQQILRDRPAVIIIITSSLPRPVH